MGVSARVMAEVNRLLQNVVSKKCFSAVALQSIITHVKQTYTLFIMQRVQRCPLVRNRIQTNIMSVSVKDVTEVKVVDFVSPVIKYPI